MFPVVSIFYLNPVKSSLKLGDVLHQTVQSVRMGFTRSGSRSLMSDDYTHFASSTWRHPNGGTVES